jgi:hypothetical protein
MIVICTRPVDGLTKGKRYEVIKANEANQYNLLLITDDFGDNYFYSRSRFITEQEWKENLKRMLNRNMIR